MKKQKEKFSEGCVQNGLIKPKAEELFHLIEPFAGYGFNKAHAACYAMIAYQTAYLKANYPVEYMTAVLTAESRANTGPARDDKIAAIVSECRRMGLMLLPPDINTSNVDFSIESGGLPAGSQGIRFGLSAIKNVGTSAIESILTARKTTQTFSSFSDFVNRIDSAKVNKKIIESLIRAGAFDAFGTRASLMASLPTILDLSVKQKKASLAGQTGLFDDGQSLSSAKKDNLPDIPEFPKSSLLAYEKELLGFYLTAHPLESLRTQLESSGSIPLSSVTSHIIGDRVKVSGIVTTVKKINTKAGNNEMAFVRIEDLTSSLEIVVFPKIYVRTADMWVRDTIVSVSGKVDEKDERLTLLVDEATVVNFEER